MDIFSAILIIIGLALFEGISSFDNAIINAEVLGTVGKKARKWFLTWGLFFGALIVRYFTINNIERVQKYVYLKNGAMYSVLFLGVIMLAGAFGIHVPHWLAPITTFASVGYFFMKSKKLLVTY